VVKAEIRQGEGWLAVGYDSAKLLRGIPMRCEACHGPVYLMQDYTGAGNTKFTHRRSFVGCGGSRGGIPLRHPTPLV